MIWAIIGIVIGLIVLSALLMPKPKIENAKAATLDQFNFPRIKEGTPVTIIYGKVRQKAPTILWYGKLKAIPIREKVKTGLFSSKRVVVGYRYQLSFQLAISLLTGSAVRLHRLWFGDKLLYTSVPGVDTDSSIAVVGKENVLGGYKNGGGYSGSFRWKPGQFNQTVDTNLETDIGKGTIPAFRGLAYAYFRNFEVGEQPQIQPTSFEVSCIPNGLGLGGIGEEANPAEVLYDLLTNKWGRCGLSSTFVNTASFIAAGTTLAAENHGISMAIYEGTDVKDAIGEVLRQIDGVLYEEPTTRQMHIKLIRNDYSIPSLPEFDESNILELSDFSVNTWEDTFNQVRIVYNSRAALYKMKAAIAQDLSNITYQDRVRSTEITYVGVTTEELANKIAARDLNFFSIPLTRLKVIANREAAVLRPGDVIKFSWPEYGISQIICRVQKFDLGELDDGRISIDLIQDRFGVLGTVFASPPDSEWDNPLQPAAPITIDRIIEVPRWFNKRIIENTEGVIGGTIDSSFVGYLASPPNENNTSFDAEVDDNADAVYSVDQDNAEFSATALVHTQYPFTTAEYDTSVGLRIKSISDTTIFAAATATAISEDGANLAIVGDEIVAYESFTNNGDGTYTLTNVWRGVLDTSPRTHAVDARVFFLDKGLSSLGKTGFDGTEDLDIKLLSKTGLSVLAPADAPVRDLQLQQRPSRPYPPDLVTLGGVAHPATLDNSVGVSVAWNRRDRLKDTITLPTAADESTVEAGTTYLARWQVGAFPVRTQSLGATSPATLNFVSGETGTTTLAIHGVKDGLESLYPVLRTFTMTGVQSLAGQAGVSIAATGNLNVVAGVLGGQATISINTAGSITVPVGTLLSSPSIQAAPIVSNSAFYTSWGTQSNTLVGDLRNNEPSVVSPNPATWTSLSASTQDVDRAGPTLAITNASNPPWIRFRNYPTIRVPGDATIQGVEVLITFGQTSTTEWLDTDVRLAWDPTTTSGGNVQTSPQNKGTNTHCSPYRQQIYGGQSDTWGASLTPAIINSPEFGVAFRPTTTNGATNTQFIDAVQIRVYYTAPSAGEARITNFFVEAVTQTDAPVRVGTIFAEVVFNNA